MPLKAAIAWFRPKAAVTSGNYRVTIIFRLKTPFFLIQHGGSRPTEKAFGSRIGSFLINTNASGITIQKTLDHCNFLGIVMMFG